MPFKAKIKAGALSSLISAVDPLVDEAKVVVAKDGLSLKAVDPAHVAMVELTLGKGAFEEFHGTDAILGVDLEKVKDILKLAAGDDEVSLTHDETNNQLQVRFGNLARRIRLVDTSGMGDPKVPKLDLPAHITLSAAELERGVRAGESVSDHVALTATPDAFELAAEGDTDTVTLRLEKSVVAMLDVKDKARSLFSLDYFANMVRAAKAAKSVTIHLGNDFPCRLEFDIADGNGHVTYLLAPRIESD